MVADPKTIEDLSLSAPSLDLRISRHQLLYLRSPGLFGDGLNKLFSFVDHEYVH